MNGQERDILHSRFGSALLKILEDRKQLAAENKLRGKDNHQAVYSLRKLAAASGIDYGTIQKISKGYQGFEFFTFIDILDALNLDISEFAKYFNSISLKDVIRDQSPSLKKKKDIALRAKKANSKGKR